MAGLQSHLAALEGAKSYAQISTALERIASDYGFTRYIYHVVRAPQGRATPKDLFTYPQAWIDVYYRSEFRKVDPVFPAAAGRVIPFRWDEVFSHRSLTDNQRNLFDEAKAHAVAQGVSVPLHGPASGFSVLSFVTDLSSKDFDDAWRQSSSELIAIGGYVHEAMLRAADNENDDTPSEPVRLTDRERDCLYWTAEGKSAWECGQILGIKETTVRYHLENAAHKLGCTSKHQAVIRAIMLNLLLLD